MMAVRWKKAGAGLILSALIGSVAMASTPEGSGKATEQPDLSWSSPHAGNPLLPGYFADPTIVQDKGEWFIFATMDPWGGDHLGLWRSKDGRNWKFSRPDWPTKAAATSPTSGDAMVWAPSVVKAPDGRWWMYVSVGSEIWVGSAPSPAGPWSDANGGKPLVNRDFAPAYHMIDAEAFVDDDGKAYLTWGSGLNWVNGHCFIARLAPDMIHFEGPVRDITPAHYFEAPFLLKSGNRYYLMYSAGNTTRDTYQVRYAIADAPMGPYKEASNSPILVTDHARNIISPGHNAAFRSGGKAYILYHRQALPWPGKGDEVLRQVAVDALQVDADGLLHAVRPTHRGAMVDGWAPRRRQGLPWVAKGQGTDPIHGPGAAADDNYATLWRPRHGAPLVADLGHIRAITTSELRPEFPGRPFRYALDVSNDGQHWRKVRAMAPDRGSPLVARLGIKARYLRLSIPAGQTQGVWEWTIR